MRRDLGIPVLLLFVSAGLLGFGGPASAQDTEPPPLPLHGIEGMGGVFSTYSAYLVNPAREGRVFGLPSVGLVHVFLGHGRNLTGFTLTETLWDRIELGFGWNMFDLGDLPQDIERATGINIDDDYVHLYNFNARLNFLKEGSFDQSWIPALTAGVHYKLNNTIDDIDDDLGGALRSIGIKDDEGWDYTLYASKMITALPRPVLLNAGLRYTKAAHLGLLGFTDDYKLTGEGNVVVFVTDRLGVSAEYRQKPNEYDNALAPLVKSEDDWWTLCACYIISNNFTVSGGYGHFGDVLNHSANNSWGFKVKWEF